MGGRPRREARGRQHNSHRHLSSHGLSSSLRSASAVMEECEIGSARGSRRRRAPGAVPWRGLQSVRLPPGREHEENGSRCAGGRNARGAGRVRSLGPDRRVRPDGDRGAVRAVEDGADQLGAMGRRRRDRRVEPDHTGQAVAGGGAGRGRRHRVSGRRRRHRRGGRQPESLRARDGRDQLGPDLDPISRHRPHASRRVGAYQRRRRLLQRLRAGCRRGPRERALEELLSTI